MDDDQQYCLRWNNHQSTLISVFDTLLENETLVDCTLAAEGKILKAHKVVLSACSPYFATLLQEQYDKHPVFILKDVKYQELRAMMDYMYRGEVNISQDQLAALLKAAESLQIKGLSDNRAGSSAAAAAPKPEQHLRGKMGTGYTLEQTKRARMATGAMDAQDVSGSREGSSSPSRRRRKVRRRSMENDAHDNSNSSVMQAAASNQLILQQSNAASALVATQMPIAAGVSIAPGSAHTSATGVAGATQGTTQQQVQPLTTTSVNKKTDSAKGITTSISTAAAAAQQSAVQTSEVINTENVQVASGSSQCGAVIVGVEEQDVKSSGDKANHKQKLSKEATTSAGGSEMVIEPKAEYDDEGHEETVEDLTLDDEEIGMEELDQTAGTSQGGEGSSQGYAAWQHDRSQEELLLATQEVQQRDPQDLSITRIAGLTWNEWNARLAMPLVTLREGVQPLIFPTDLSLDKPLVGVTKIKLDPNDRKTPIESDTPPEELSGNASNNRSSTPRNILTAEKLCTSSTSKLKHLTEEEATALMLKAAAEKSSNAAAAAAASNNSGNLSDTSYGGDDNVGGGTGSDFHSTLSGAVAFAADVGSAAGLCNINILNSINAMNSLISGNASSGSVSLSGPLSSSNNVSGNGSNPSGTSGSGGGHPCPVCGRVYKLKSSLRNHQKWECGKEPQFQCPFCVYRAKQKMHIGRHMERMHKEKFIKLEDLKSYTGSDESTASAVAAAATAAANALASTAELHQHFT